MLQCYFSEVPSWTWYEENIYKLYNFCLYISLHTVISWLWVVIMTFVPRTTSFHSISMLELSDSSSTYVQEKRFHSMSICLMVKYLCSCRCYPFYYAPFASDFKCLSQFNISFTVDKPLRPFDQLVAVLPPEKHVSLCALPKCYSKLIGCEESTIQKFYPSGI